MLHKRLKNKAISSVAFLWLGSLLGSGSTFAVYVILARKLGADDFGIFSSSVSIASILVIISGFGIGQAWLKLFGEHGWNALCWIVPSIRLLVVMIFLSAITLSIWAYVGPHAQITGYVLLIMICFVSGQVGVELVESKFQLEEHYIGLMIWRLLPNILRLIVMIMTIYFISDTFSVITAAWVYAAVGILLFMMSVCRMSGIVGNANFRLSGHGERPQKMINSPKKVRDVLIESWPFGLSSIFAFIYIQSDIIMIKYIVGDSEAGYYNVAFLLFIASTIFPSVLYSKFFLPKYHRWAYHDQRRFYENYKISNIMMLLSGLSVMIILLLTSNQLVPFVFGEEYKRSIFLTNIIALTIPLYFVIYSAGATLVTRNHMRSKVKLMGIVSLINILLNLFLIPKYQSAGAAVATLISNSALLVMYYLYAQHKVFNMSNV